MKNYESIPIVEIKDFKKDSSNLLVSSLDELYNENHNILTRPHRIFYYQVILIVKGNGNYCVDSLKYNYTGRSLLATSKGQVEIFDKDMNAEGYVLVFSEEYLCKYKEDFSWINSLKLFDLSIQHISIKLSDIEFIDMLINIKKIEMELKSGNNFAKDEILINMVKNYLLMSERFKRADIGNENEYNEGGHEVAEFKKKLEEHYCCTRSVNDYADLLSITPKKLNQLTNSYWGKPAKRIIEERVLLEVKRLLIHTPRSIKEIGCSLGFNDPTNFNKFFKRYIGKTPAYFRESNKNII